MYVSWLFWLALALPGYVIVRHLFRDDLESGLLGTIGLSYLAVFGLLTPISIGCYLFKAPVWVFTSACILAILAAPIELSRRKWWGGLFRMLLAGACVELLLVLADMFFSARVGSFFLGDARVHLARIRFLLDHGFSNLDPYCAEPYFYPIYHTNVIHAFYAAATQVSGGDHLAVWFASLPWGKLLGVTGVYYMVWSIFDRKWPAWIAALCVLAHQAPVTFMIYPNKLAPFWLAPYVVGFAVQACRAPTPPRVWIKLAAGALVLGQVHGLYAIYTVGLVLPVIGAVLFYRLARRRPGRRSLAACAFAVCLALPFPIVSNLKAKPTTSTGRQFEAADDTTGRYLHFDNGWLMLNPKNGIGPAGLWTVPVFLLGIVTAMLGRRRRDAAVMLAIGCTAAAVFYVPPLCAFVTSMVQRDWIFSRFSFSLSLFYLAFAPGALAFAVESRTKRWWVRSLISLAVFAALFPLRSEQPFDWRTYLQTATAAESRRLGNLRLYQTLASFLDHRIPPGRTVVCHPAHGFDLVMTHDAYLVASGSSSIGVLDLSARKNDLYEMISTPTPWPRRQALLDKYDAEYFLFYENNPPPTWAAGHLTQVGQPLRVGAGFFMIMRLKKG